MVTWQTGVVAQPVAEEVLDPCELVVRGEALGMCQREQTGNL